MASYFPHLGQTPHTLYVIWPHCPSGGSRQGLNIELSYSTRTLIIHCYAARQWLYAPGAPGVGPTRSWSLLSVPTDTIGPGRLNIDEDDRIEHLFGDQSDQHQLATATIT